VPRQNHQDNTTHELFVSAQALIKTEKEKRVALCPLSKKQQTQTGCLLLICLDVHNFSLEKPYKDARVLLPDYK